MAKHLKRRTGLLLAALVLLLAIGTLWFEFWSEFDEDPFLVGASLNSDGDVILLVGQCGGGRLEHLDVAVDPDDGFASVDQRLWAIDAPPGGGVPLVASAVLEVKTGVTPAEMTETAPLIAGLPHGDTLQVNVDTSVQQFGFFFRLDDLAEGDVWASGRGLLSPKRFHSVLEDNCD